MPGRGSWRRWSAVTLDTLSESVVLGAATLTLQHNPLKSDAVGFFRRTSVFSDARRFFPTHVGKKRLPSEKPTPAVLKTAGVGRREKEPAPPALHT